MRVPLPPPRKTSLSELSAPKLDIRTDDSRSTLARVVIKLRSSESTGDLP